MHSIVEHKDRIATELDARHIIFNILTTTFIYTSTHFIKILSFSFLTRTSLHLQHSQLYNYYITFTILSNLARPSTSTLLIIELVYISYFQGRLIGSYSILINCP